MSLLQTPLDKYSRIGLFDSGVGGLSVLRRIAALDGERSFVYLGDSARCPYGNKEAAEIAAYVDQIVKWLIKQDVDAIVMACNTSAAVAYDVAAAVSSVPVYDLIRPTAAYAAALGRKVGVMATASTAKSKAFSRAINAIAPALPVVEYGCPELVPIVEGGTIDSPATLAVLNNYVERLVEDGVQELILGCTHFPFLRLQIEALAQGRFNIIDPAEALAGKPASRPFCLEKLNSKIFVTGDPQPFARAAGACLGQDIAAVTQVSVEQLTVTLVEEMAVGTAAVLPLPAVQVAQ